MAQDNADNAPARGLSSFANLLGSNAGTISSAPVMYNQQPGPDGQQQDATPAKKQQINSAALRFQPTKRPQVQAQKKTKPAFPKPVAPAQGSSSPDPQAAANKSSGAVALAANPPSKASLADFLGNDADEGFYAASQPRERGGRKNKKKKKKNYEAQEQNWDDIYDPTRPNDYNQYKGSEEQMREIGEWKDLLYRHRSLRELSKEYPESDEEEYERSHSKPQFAPPKSYNFAPPSDLNTPTPPVPSAPAEASDDPNGEDAYARRVRLSGLGAPPPPPEESADALPPPPPTEAPPPPPADGSISRAPVRYNVPPPEQLSEKLSEEIAAEEEEAARDAEDGSRSKAPGQKGFAQRMMEKYGWEKGKGLGANENGIITPLAMKAEKRKKLADAQGGGWATPAGMGKITGGKKAKVSEDEGKHGKMSAVVVMSNMLVGLDLQQELDDGSLMQEIGEELDKAGGRIERIYIDRYSGSGDVPVFAKFTNELSALRAVNAMDGRVFNGNTIHARYFDVDKFEQGDYSL
ncbi:g-patch dna repair protein [Diplodia corticola]|uniref:G-patch dna repair protein n=1 Tax=Diplodia corticola TaxID=236234 RepID=A0A1J9RMH7_9PEZI|nr:g-patch dna repair protein [Diplodia corticola]OJD28805.1 g-patch dna repair protein [Diplodia corticola]